MRRWAGSRLGALVSLSVVVSVCTATGVAPSATAGREETRAVTTAAPTARQAVEPEKPDLSRVKRAIAKDARRVELPRPVRGATAVRLLGDQLDEAAALNDVTETKLVELLRTDPTVWLDSAGFVFFKDEPAIAPAVDPVSAAAPLEQTFLLHSKPGAQRSIYLDFDGGTASATSWHANSPGTPTTQPAWDLSGNPAVFDTTELTSIQTVWQSVAEDFAPFDVDVTTADPGAAGIFRASAADNAYGSHVLITPSNAAHDAICGSCGGVAYLNVFDAINGNGGGAAGDGNGYMQPAWVFPQKLGDSPKNIAEAVSHEVGHNFGLAHDGNASQGYDTGHGAWAPIMGVGYSHPISQWSKGDYDGANNTEDDVDIIREVTGARFDEAGSSIAGAAALPTGTAYVARRTDIDTYLLGTCAGSVTVNATTPEFANLDIQVSILDLSGTVVASADPASAQTSTSVASGMSASLTQTLSSGTYYVSVDGVGNGAWSTGYDDYGSLGAYTLAVTGSCNGAAPTGTPSAPTSVAAAPDASLPTVTVTWAAPASAGSSAVTGYVLEHSGSEPPVQVGPTATSYVWTGLDFATAYSFTVTALNAQGPGTSVTVDATTASTVPSVPQGITASWDSLDQVALLGWRPPARKNGSAVTSYQVFVDGVHRYNVGGAGTIYFPLTPGTHTLGVAATNQVGRSPTASVSVVVPPRPANDAFAQRTTLAGVSGTIAGDNLESSAEAGEVAPTATRPNPGNASLWYSWTAPASGPVTMSTGSTVTDRDTTLNVYTGSQVYLLTDVAGNDEPGGASHLAAVSFTASAGTTYVVAVNGYRTFATGVGPFSLTWTGTAPPPAAVTTTTLGSVVSGRSATLTASVTATSGTPAGNVQFHDGAVLVGTQPVASGTASIVLSDLVKGDHPYRATFVPTNSALFTTSQSSIVTSTIAGTSTTTTLSATGGINTVNLTAGVTVAAGTATGAVQFHEGPTLVGSATVSSGSAVLALTGVTPGDHTYVATFVPADTQRFDGSVSAGNTVTVDAPPVAKVTTTSLTATPTGRSVDLAATVTATSGTPAGSVQFRDGGTVVGTVPLAGGTASLQVNDLLRGTHHFTAEFVPTDASAYEPSQSSDSEVEIAATPTATSLSTSVTGRSVTLQASVSPTVAGTVQFREGATLVGTVALAAGAGQVTLSNVPAGDHTYTASFVPADDLRHAPSTSTDKNVTVLATPTSTALGSSVSNHRVTLTSTVTSGVGSPAGSVEFREGTALVGTSAVASGTATLVLDDVPTGGHAYTATFVPSAPTSYAGSVSSVHNATVVATATTTDLSAGAVDRTVTLTATPSTGNGTLAGSVEFREGAALVGTVPLGAGSTVLTLTLVNPGSHGYTATFVPSSTSHASSVSPLRSVTVQVSSTTGLIASTSGRDVTLDASVATDGGSPAGTVEFRDGSTLLASKPVSAGAASLTMTNVNPGDHTYTATFVPTDPTSYTGSTSPDRLVTVAKVATTTALTASASGQTVTLTATPASTSGTVTGSVDFWEDTTLVGSIPLSGGTAVGTLTGVAPGDHTYSATFVPTGTFHSGSMSPSRSVTVARIATSTALTADVAGRAVTLTATPATTSGALSGSVEFHEGPTLVGTVTLTGASSVLELTGVDPGNHTYTATFVPTGTSHSGSTSSAVSASVAKVATTTGLTASADGRTVTLTATPTTGSGTLTGSVEFRDGITVLGTVPLGDGSTVFTQILASPGSHDYTATFVPNGDFHTGSVSPTRNVVVQVSSTTDLAASSTGRNVTLDATLTTDGGTPAGTVEFREGAIVVGTRPVAAGAASLTLTDVAPGDHSYTATFLPANTAAYQGSASPARTVTVAKIATATALTADVAGLAVTLTATPSTTSGTLSGAVEFREGGVLLGTVTLAGGTAVLQVTGVEPGDHDYRATFVPTGTSHLGSVSPIVTAEVGKIATATALESSVSDQTVTLTATPTTGSGTLAGAVEFRDGTVLLDTVTLEGADVALTLADVAPGEHTYTAKFVPTGTTHAGSTSPDRTVTVARIATNTALTAAVDGRTVTLTASPTTGSGTLSGSVRFRENGTLLDTVDLTGSDVVLTLSDVVPGDHTYTATYVPSGTTHAGSTSPEKTVTVAKIATSTALTADVVGHAVTLTASPTTASGTLAGAVEFHEGESLLGTVTLSDGTAVLELTGVDPGEHDYRATFVPTGTTHTGSTSPTVTASVDLIETTTALDIGVDGRTVTLTATPTADSSAVAGRVEFRADGDLIDTVDVVSGAATKTLTNVQPGEHTYSARFVPTDPATFAGSSSQQTVNVARVATSTSLTAAVDERTVTLTAAVMTASGSPSGEVQFVDEYDNVVATEPLTNGSAVATFEHVYPGDYGYTATFVPTGSFHAASTSQARTVTVSDAPVTTTTTLEASAVGRTVTLKATVTSLEGTPEGMVEFRDDGEVVQPYWLSNGVAEFEFNVAAGTHHYTATFVPDPGMFAPSSSPTRTLTVAPTGTTTTLVASATDDQVTLAATVTTETGPPGSYGTLEFREGSTLLEVYGVVASGDPVVHEVPNVVGGSHTYTATYVSEDGNFAASSGDASVVVDKTTTSIGLTATRDGRRVTLTAPVSSPIGSPAGTVQFEDGGTVVDTATVAGGSATLVRNGVDSGSHDYTATFIPTQNTRYHESTSVVRNVTLTPSATTTTLAATAGANSVNIDAHVTSPDGVPSGVVTITEGGVPVASGTGTVNPAGRAIFSIPNIPTGSHNYVAHYGYTAAGSQFAASSSQPVTLQVSNVAPAAATSTSLTAGVSRRTVSLQASVSSASGTPTGSVQFREDGIAVDLVPLVNGSATLTRDAVAAGPHSYTATFTPANPAAFASSASPTRTVTAQRTVTTATLAGSVNDTTVTLDIAVAATDGIVPTGQVRVLSGTAEVGTVLLSGGTATLVLSPVAVGTSAYRAVFDGSADLAESSSAPLELTVAAPPAPPATTPPPPTTVPPDAAPAASTTKVVAPKKAKLGSRPVIKVVVARGSAAASGKVIVKVGTKSTTLTLKAGTAQLKLPKLKRKLKITVRYLGNATTTASSATWTIKVKPG